MASFGPKRKARIIKVDDLEDALGDTTQTADAEKSIDVPKETPAFSRASRKPLRQSGLRKSLNATEIDQLSDDTSHVAAQGQPVNEEDEAASPVVFRPALSRSASTKQKKRKSSSRLSFGQLANEDDQSLDNTEVFTPKKSSLGQKALENNAIRRGVTLSGLPMRVLGDDDDRPRYSKEYLDELQSSTPNTPRDLRSQQREDNGDNMELDLSELDGAVIVESSDLASTEAPRILTETEIQERKERRARLAQEQDFLSLDASDVEDNSFFPKKKKEDTRLVREDEDLGEGFDDFVEDGGLALGKKATRESKKQHRKEMADLIREAEGNSDEESDESEAERRVAFEAAQTRSGMDGLDRPAPDADDPIHQPKPKITPLLPLSETIEALRAATKKMELQVTTASQRVSQLKLEKEEIMQREVEVQRLLNEAGEKYLAATGNGVNVPRGAIEPLGQSPARPSPAGGMHEYAMERGLESFGTPSRKGDDSGAVDDLGDE